MMCLETGVKAGVRGPKFEVVETSNHEIQTLARAFLAYLAPVRAMTEPFSILLEEILLTLLRPLSGRRFFRSLLCDLLECASDRRPHLGSLFLDNLCRPERKGLQG